ncbi:serine protease [Actinokineospora diospyrosa]|uniref:Trypsin n=1 Tax=Actinokineospora diospyrosa TaxID=103728 RepID=A0ABT1ICA7_9PSEU|nr:serine protease [Actinokineospora diospyrosa]MCP2270268.1 trypsin [Actinokineospora diospyrosa]
MRRLLSCTVAVLLAATLGPIAAAEDRIVGGERIDINEAPWTLSLRENGNHICGAALIAHDIALTAAHCVVGNNDLSVRAGSTNRTEGGVKRDVRKVVRAPKYDEDEHDHDIAVLYLDRDISYSSNIRPITVAEREVPAGTRALVTGWGVLTEGGSSPENLRGVVIPTVSLRTCRDSYGQDAVTIRMLCAGLPQGGKDSCQGDSGGPLTDKPFGRDPELVGLVSWGRGCARPGYYGVYTNVAQPALRRWIQEETGK